MSKDGGCLCGAVRYSVTGDIITQVVCHCRNCQKQAGSAFSVLFLAAEGDVTVTGELRTYEDTGDSGDKVMRQFCPICGSPIFSLLPGMPGVKIVKAGTLDDPAWLEPKMHVWCDSAQPWFAIDPDAQQLAKGS